ncbi:MAG TPA: hypothetical protein DDY98_05635 [Ruminococcaceae bacterium]|nr:hypothetical protein [Oscillospiraceae bacterium]
MLSLNNSLIFCEKTREKQSILQKIEAFLKWDLFASEKLSIFFKKLLTFADLRTIFICVFL